MNLMLSLDTQPTVATAIKFDKPVFIRAKAFKQGAVDLYGAAEFYAVKGAH
jgi:hypothetical protein